MAILKVGRIGHPVVRGTAKPVPLSEIETPAFQRLVDDMVETMHEYDGVGLAAPQIHVAWRLAVIEILPTDERAEDGVPVTVLVNPKLTPLGKRRIRGVEGCLSVPGFRGVVPRHERVRLEALDRHGRPWSVEAHDFYARVIQHECDHLDGRVYLDRMEGLRSLAYQEEFDRFGPQEPVDEGDAD